MYHAHGKDKGSSLTRIEESRRIEEKTGRKMINDPPELPPSLIQVWNLYVEIKGGCDSVTTEAIYYFCVMNGDKISPWELSVLIDIDRVRIKNGN